MPAPRPIRNAARTLRRAFTLVEVLVVVAILGIAGAVVVPALNSAGQLGAQGAARQIIADILIAQSEAVAAQDVRRVWFFPSDGDGGTLTNAYQLEDAAGRPMQTVIRGGGPSQYRIDLDSDDRFRDTIIENLQPEGSGFISFDPLGSPIDGPNGNPSVQSFDLRSPGARYRVNIRPVTGRVTIESLGLNG